MKSLTQPKHALLVAGASAAVALAAMCFAQSAHARDNVTFSVGIGVPGVVIGASNAYPVYTQPQVVYTQPQVVYAQPRPVYIQPRPVWVQPAPVYYQPAPVYYSAPQPMYYGRPPRNKHGHHHKHGWQNQGYAPVYYQR